MNNIKRIRESRGISAVYVQKKLEVTRTMYHYIEYVACPQKYVDRLCTLFKVDRVTLLGEDVFDIRYGLTDAEKEQACRRWLDEH